MKLLDLLENLDFECIQGDGETEISAVVYDSRKVVPGCLFICIEGVQFDGHDYVRDAVRQKAAMG